MSRLDPDGPLAPRHPLPRSRAVDRDAELLRICRGKKVLHLACAAWPATKKWAQDGSLLHLRLANVAEQLAGFDWSEEGLRVLQDHGVGDLDRVDLLQSADVKRSWQSLSFEPDIVLAGEFLEHLDRPGVLLENLRATMPPQAQLVVTVPSAFSLHSWLHVLRGYEKVAPDHVSYYSFANLRELLRRNGFCLQAVRWYHYSARAHWIDRLFHGVTAPITWMWPQFSDGLIALCGCDEPHPRRGSGSSSPVAEDFR